MGLLDSTRAALNALRVNLLRSVLTVLGIIIGVGAVIAMVSVGAGAQARVTAQIQNLGSNLIVITPGSASTGGVRLGQGTRPSTTTGDAAAIAKEIPGVQAVAPSMWASACCQVVYRSSNWWTATQGTVPEYQQVRQWPLSLGRFFTEDDMDAGEKVALIGQTVTGKLFGAANPLGEVIRVSQVPFVVVGLLASKGRNARGEDQDDVVLIPLTTARRLITPWGPRGDGVHAISVRVKDGVDIKVAEGYIRDLLRQRHQLQSFQDDDFTIQNLAEVLQAEQAAARTLTILLGAIASVSLLVGGIGVMNIMLVSVTERTKEIGLRMAVGARAGDILTQFLVEAVALSLIGGTLGITLGVGGSVVISRLAGWRTVIQPAAILIAFAFAAVVGISFGLYPARKASLLDPVEALRYE
jgi:putative ABC transport system permease protein